MLTHVLDHYQGIHDASGRMLEAARAGDLEALAAAEEDCVRHVESLRRLGPMPYMDERLRRTRLALLHTVIERDAQLRNILHPALHRLGHLLGRDRPTRVSMFPT